ncbi:MAG: OmpA family protein [Rubrivivax sp.]|nr:OmpA family protein [Rubrivivax sp.]
MVLAAASAGLAASCSAPVVATSSLVAPSRGPTPVAIVHVAQLDFGRLAGFATCLPPACPAVTPKTLPGERQPTAPVPPPAVELPESLGRGETVLPAEQRRDVPAVPANRVTPRADAAGAARQVVVQFAFGNATLSPTARALIDEAAEAAPTSRRVAISGRTDSVGPPQVNQALALARAEAVREHLRARHPRLAPVLTVQAEGACCYAASNDSASGRAMNRRVEVVFERYAEDL